MDRYADFLRAYMHALKRHHAELTVTTGLLGFVVIASGLAMYVLERDAGTFQSLGEAWYWSVITVTTVGYGDIVPATGPGRAVTAVTSLLGAGFLLLTAGILAASFMEEMRQFRGSYACPSCGEKLESRGGRLELRRTSRP